MHNRLQKLTENHLRLEGRTGTRAPIFALISLVILLGLLGVWFALGSLYAVLFKELVLAGLVPRDTGYLFMTIGIASSAILFYTVFLSTRKNKKCLLFKITAHVEKRIIETLTGWPTKEIKAISLVKKPSFPTHTPPPPETPPRGNLA